MPYNYEDLIESLELEPGVEISTVEADRGPTWGINIQFTDPDDTEAKTAVRGLIETHFKQADYEVESDSEWVLAGAK